jgi:hypothetical protein
MYGGGVVRLSSSWKIPNAVVSARRWYNSLAVRKFSPLPSTIAPPTAEELKEMQTKLNALQEPLPSVYAAYHGEDWKTKGNWYGRITSEFAVLCAMDAPLNHYVCWAGTEYIVKGFIGPNHAKDDSLRHWLHWRRAPDRRSLWNISYAFHRQAEWNDHGEVYPMAMDGPDLWYFLDIKNPGVFQLSMYFFNKDGHEGHNRFRDYMIEIYPASQSWKTTEQPLFKFDDWPKHSQFAEKQLSKMPPLAKSRMRDFWGGVHKQFIVKGPGLYFVKIDRNYSFNTILSGIFIRQLYGEPTKDIEFGIPDLHHTKLDTYVPPKSYEDANERILSVLWKTLDEKYPFEKYANYEGKYRKASLISAVRRSEQEDASESIKTLTQVIRYRLKEWDGRLWTD